jgi:aryl-alcohol dehydrogenase-like predicted oxidoreductase
MRYRPFTKSGVAASAITLILDDTPMRQAERLQLVYAALECGVNSFELQAGAEGAASALQQALAQLDRGVVVISVRVGRRGDAEVADFRPDAVLRDLAEAGEQAGLDRFDAVLLDNPVAGSLSRQLMAQLCAMRDEGLIRMIGITGASEAVDTYAESSAFDLLATSFNIRSGWPERNRIKHAVQRGMTVMGCDYLVGENGPVESPAPRKGLAKLFAKRAEPVAVGPYEFLRGTPKWTPEAICLAYALTEPSLASVRVRAHTPAEVAALAEAADRDLPTGLAAQIEMARFAAIA